MLFTMIIMGLLVLFMLAGVLPSPGGLQAAVFRTPMFVILAGLLVASLVRCSWKQGFSIRRLGFQLMHLGVCVLLAGAWIGFLRGIKTDLMLPLDESQVIREYPLDQNGQTIFTNNFGVAALDFKVRYYDPAYALYRPQVVMGNSDYALVKRCVLGKDRAYDLGEPGGRIPESALKDFYGDWQQQYALTNGWILQIDRPVAKEFHARLRFHGDLGKTDDRDLRVNHPVEYDGWRFYLVSYDTLQKRYVVVTAKKDPGRGLVIGGIWMALLGAPLMCFAKRGGSRGTV